MYFTLVDWVFVCEVEYRIKIFNFLTELYVLQELGRI